MTLGIFADGYAFDEKRTAFLLKKLVGSPKIGKILLEPHLKSRLALNYDKVRFQGCHSVRHDDHVHIQLP